MTYADRATTGSQKKPVSTRGTRSPLGKSGGGSVRIQQSELPDHCGLFFWFLGGRERPTRKHQGYLCNPKIEDAVSRYEIPVVCHFENVP